MRHATIDQAIELLMLGLKDLDHLLTLTEDHQPNQADHQQLVFYTSTLTQLTETTGTLKLDTDYVLKKDH